MSEVEGVGLLEQPLRLTTVFRKVQAPQRVSLDPRHHCAVLQNNLGRLRTRREGRGGSGFYRDFKGRVQVLALKRNLPSAGGVQLRFVD